MKRVRAVQAGLVIAALLAPLLPRQDFARADQVPAAGRYDSRMRYIAYNPSQVVHLSTVVGDTMVVSFSSDETVTSVAVTDSLHLAAVPKGNYLFFKPSAPLAVQPVIVLTQRANGALRRYVFEIETVDLAAEGSDGVFYSVQFTYPEDAAVAAAARAAAQARKVDELNAQALAAANQRSAEAILDAARSDPYAGPRNYRYVAQGDKSLVPLLVWDNGYSTVLQFAGNARLPAVFVVNPDGKEATASYAVNGSSVQIGQTAREFRLRDGGTVLNIYNLGFDSVGGNPGTGTTSPEVTRTVDGGNSDGAPNIASGGAP